jgi:serine/threonine protein kinase/tetratricopeptide (TPR) repeat protein
MTAQPADDPDSAVDLLVAELADEFRGRQARGQVPDPADYAARHPEAGDLIRRVLGTLRLAANPPLITPPEPESSVPGVLGDYRIIHEVGRGGMGVVYEAEQLSLSRRVALKVLPFAATMDPKQLQRFQNEARAAASLHHPNIAPVYGVGSDRGVHYYAMHFIDGRPLTDLVREGGRDPFWRPSTRAGPAGTQVPDTVPVAWAATALARGPAEWHRQVAELGIQAAEALEYAHSVGIVHRDVKPGNLMIQGEPGAAGVRLWVTDFGLAKFGDTGMTVSGDLLGTLRYMSPEQALARHGLVDHRTDVYSLGATLYELLTGRPLISGDDRQAVLRQIAFEEPVRPRRLAPALSRDLETVLLKCLEKSPELRYPTAKELADDLRRFLSHESPRARRPTPFQRGRKWAKRHAAILSTAASTAILMLVVGATLLWQENNRTRTALAHAQAQRSLARRTVDQMYTEVAESWLASSPRMTAVQRDFLLKALAFYEEFAQEEGTDPVVKYETAQAYRRVGDIQRKLWRYPEAEAAYRAAIRLLRELAELDPGRGQYRFDLARCSTTLGYVLDDTGRVNEALAAHRTGLEIIDGLVAEFPEDASYRAAAGNSSSNLANTSQSVGRYEEAETLFARGLDTFGALVTEFPADQSYVYGGAICLESMGEMLLESGQLVRSEQCYRRALPQFELLLAASPEHPGYRHNQAKVFRGLGDLSLRTGDLEAARTWFEKALAAEEQLSRDYPQVPWYPEGVACALQGLGKVHAARGRTSEATTALRRAVPIHEMLVRDGHGGGRLSHQLLLAIAHGLLGDKGQARHWYEESVRTVQTGQPVKEGNRRLRIEVEELLGVSRE